MATEERRYPDADPSLSYDLAKNELSILLSSVDALDSKIAAGVSLATALVAVLLTFIGIRTGQQADIISSWSLGLIATTAALYIATMTCFGLAFLRRAWEIGLNARDVWYQAERYRDYPRILYWWATEELMESLTHNHVQYRRKQLLTTGAFFTLACQLATGAAAVALTFK